MVRPPEEVRSGIIALPAEDVRLLFRQAYDLVVSALVGHRLEFVHGENGDIPTLSTGMTLHFGASDLMRINLVAWDRDQGSTLLSWPPPLRSGSWLTVSASSDRMAEGAVFSSTMGALAFKLGGFLSFAPGHTWKADDDIRTGWAARSGDSPLEGVDVVKHRLLRTIGFEDAPAVERILRSAEAKAVLARALVDEPRGTHQAGH